ncbi:unnamed protein product [Clonostachys rhizophaga]|uniref:(2E,6E)-farnesyl diphosphate synthase n=1 Tax=Clonostachys rhizophaga TaxID=160324 RepID=A0A9N9YVF4_9HYPO|nr:unnamed protein product [Clonostachys rhizophaga]
MEYKYSEIIESDTQGLCLDIPVRKHLNASLEDRGSREARADWERFVGPLSQNAGAYCEGHSFVAISVPDCLPDRLEVISYANEFAFLHDDVTDVADQDTETQENDHMLQALMEGVQQGSIEARESGKRQIQAKILMTMMALDRDRAKVATTAWAKFLEQGSGRENHNHFSTLEEYLPYRSKDSGHMFWHAISIFGCGLTIPDHELALVTEYVMPASLACSLQNDLLSFGKEYEAALEAGQTEICNALWVLMGEHNCTLKEAKALCIQRIHEEVRKYLQYAERAQQMHDLSSDGKKYVDMMRFTISGNAAWSVRCPRYNRQLQITINEDERLTLDGIPKKLKSNSALIEKSTSPESIASDVSDAGYVTANTDSESDHSDAMSRVTIDGVDRPETPAQESKIHELKADSIGPVREPLVLELDSETSNWSSLGPEEAALAIYPQMKSDVVTEPYRYLSSLPSKGVRDMTINALNFWLKVPNHSMDLIKSAVRMLHGSSLMLDDIEDGSRLRRGKPSTHEIFGHAQTINSATYQYINATQEIRKLRNPHSIDIFIDEVQQLFIGQSYDLLWTSELSCPTVPEYLQMIDGKTGGLFRLLTRLMVAESKYSGEVDFARMCSLFGRYFQIRDDYQNLTSDDYTNQKGFCEDLDEGKYSLPLILALTKSPRKGQINSLLVQRRVTGSLTYEQKCLILEHIRRSGALEATKTIMVSLAKELEGEVDRLGKIFGEENLELKLIQEMLKV